MTKFVVAFCNFFVFFYCLNFNNFQLLYSQNILNQNYFCQKFPEQSYTQSWLIREKKRKKNSYA